MRAYVESRNATPTADEEYLRVFRGYNDGFIFYTCLVTLMGLGWLGAQIPIGPRVPAGPIDVLPIMAPLLAAAGSWGLAEYFTLRRKAAMASILLSFTLGLSVLVTLMFIVMPIVRDAVGGAILIALCAGIAAAASWGFWLRFRVASTPMVTAGLGVIGIVVFLSGVLAGAPAGIDVLNVVLLLCGIAAFACAMWHDSADPWRVGERNEIGLWMHILAAMLIVNPVIYLLGVRNGVSTVGGVITMVVLFLLLALVALIVNRKAYVFAALSPLLLAAMWLINGSQLNPYNSYDPYGAGFGGAYGGSPYGPPPGYGGMGRNPMMPDVDGMFAAFLVISVVLLALAIWWTPLRRIVSNILPESIRARAPLADAGPLAEAAPYASDPPPPQPPVA